MPKSGGSSSRDSPNLTHSASTPSFSSFGHVSGLAGGSSIPNPATAGESGQITLLLFFIKIRNTKSS